MLSVCSLEFCLHKRILKLKTGQKFAMMEEKVILASVLRRFHVRALDKPTDLPVVTELVLRPLDAIRVCLTRRTLLTD